MKISWWKLALLVGAACWTAVYVYSRAKITELTAEAEAAFVRAKADKRTAVPAEEVVGGVWHTICVFPPYSDNNDVMKYVKSTAPLPPIVGHFIGEDNWMIAVYNDNSAHFGRINMTSHWNDNSDGIACHERGAAIFVFTGLGTDYYHVKLSSKEDTNG